jgi:NTP pyrophosphatase (non-canonical NTP hydrolase)
MDIKETAIKINDTARSKGFWDKPRNFGEMLMLIVSELGEALEAHRKSKTANRSGFEHYMQDWTEDMSDYTRKFKTEFESCVKDSIEDELADAAIRLFDTAYGNGIDLEWFIEQKMKYNATREHMHGKAY